MDFDLLSLAAAILAAMAFFEAVSIRRLLQKIHAQIDTIEIRAEDAAREAASAKQVSLNAWEDTKRQRSQT